MGVVRREGDWRLEKEEDGLYHITYQKDLQLKVVVRGKYSPSGFDDARNDVMTRVEEVDSISDAKTLFEQEASDSGGGGGGLGFGESVSASPSSSGSAGGAPATGDDVTLDDLPPGGAALVLFIVGGAAIQQVGLAVSSPVFLVGVGFVIMGLAILGYAGLIASSAGPIAAVSFLVGRGQDSSSSETKSDGGTTVSEPETTPPAPESLKNEIYFDRADQHCEWCDDRTDSPEVHHIEPRSEGGSNDHDNLIALCPSCHSRADKGGISRAKLRAKVDRQNDGWSPE